MFKSSENKGINMKGQEAQVILVIGAIIAVVVGAVMLFSVAIPVLSTGANTSSTVTNEKLGSSAVFNLTSGVNSVLTSAHPIVSGTTTVKNSTGFTLTSTSYTLVLSTGNFTLTNSSINGTLNMTYDYATYQPDTGTQALINLMPLILVGVFILAILGVFGYMKMK